ncbi:MAG: SIMPL domain-containing protein [Tissierellia bacterium]|nr:SIMPL domain-containing protein [Tissierellia bacterium]MDD4780294.1 SIMPL domain-containing protein [Tissierellia bacterium]
MSKSLSNNSIENRIMTLTGQGQISLVPNIAIIRLGVQTLGQNLVTIQSENSRKSQAIIQVLKNMGISDIKTFQYTIDKIFDYENGKQIDRGYSVRNIIEIRTNNMDRTGAIIDAAVKTGANVVDFISFDVTDKEYYYQQALNLATMNAIQKSKSLSVALGISVDPIPIKITENSQFAIPYQQFQRDVASTPIMPGNIRIEASVTAEFIY